MPYELRCAEAGDMELLMRIGHEGIRPYVQEVWGWDQADQERRFAASFDPDITHVVQVNGRDVGFLAVAHNDDRVFLTGIYLDKEVRRQGVGAELIRDLIERCRDLRKPLRLRVLHCNPAQHLYHRLGFQVIDSTETHIYMEVEAK